MELLENRLFGIFSTLVPSMTLVKPIPARFKEYLREFGLRCADEALERAAKIATEMWLEGRTLTAAEKPVQIYSDSVQEAIRSLKSGAKE